MNENTTAVIPATFEASNNGQIHFGGVIGPLMGGQVESDHVGNRSGRTTCYIADGTPPDVEFEGPQQAIAEVFDGVQRSWAGNNVA